MNYNKYDDLIYINSIINIDDHLSRLKNNPLVKNYKYPTQLFSFVSDFWNLSLDSNKDIMQSNGRLEENIFHDKNSEGSNNKYKTIHNNKFKKTIRQKEKDKTKEIVREDEEIYLNEEEMFLPNSFINNKENLKNNFLFKYFNSELYDLLMNELNNVNDILHDINTSSKDEMDILGDYLQNGLLIPIIFFFKKAFALAHYLTGIELIKLYDLIIQGIQLKVYISKFKYKFWNKNNEYDNIFDDILISSYFCDIFS